MESIEQNIDMLYRKQDISNAAHKPVGLYKPYENKLYTGEEAARCRSCLEQRIISAGYKAIVLHVDVIR